MNSTQQALDRINNIHGTDLRIGQAVRLPRAPKRDHVGVIVGTCNGYVKLMHDGHKLPYPAAYHAGELVPTD